MVSGLVRTMATKLEEFLAEKKIDRRRLLSASADLERLRPEDRAIRLAQRKARKSEDKKKEGLAAKKPRSGRPLTERALEAALLGKPISGPSKTRVLRAVNQILKQKALEPVTLHALFDLPPKGGSKPATPSE
jgi:hypothetical protein